MRSMRLVPEMKMLSSIVLTLMALAIGNKDHEIAEGAHNEEHGITPKSIEKAIFEIEIPDSDGGGPKTKPAPGRAATVAP